jgi:hypothetical protein
VDVRGPIERSTSGRRRDGSGRDPGADAREQQLARATEETVGAPDWTVPAARLGRARALLALGRRDEAEREVRATLEREEAERDAELCEQALWALHELGRDDEARALLARYRVREPHDEALDAVEQVLTPR